MCKNAEQGIKHNTTSQHYAVFISISLRHVLVVHSTSKYMIQVHKGKVCYKRGLPSQRTWYNTVNIIPNKGVIKM